MIFLSVIIPCYNVSKYITDCLESIFANDVTSTEVLIIDDGSTDNLEEVLTYYFNVKVSENTYFTYCEANIHIIQQDNQGVSAARNKGIAHASGEYIIFIDPDDTVKSDYFSNVLKLLSSKTLQDVLILGFFQRYEDAHGNEFECFSQMPKRLYVANCLGDSVTYILPHYLGYSVKDMQIGGGV